jgi:glycyl-tRNA synthetase
MAHYAKDCWDAEVETSYGWIEIAGHADRSCYDLSRHSKRTKTELVAARLLPEPKLMKYVKVTPNKQAIGKTFKQDSKGINDVLEEASEEEKLQYLAQFEATGEVPLKVSGDKEIKLDKDFLVLELAERTQHEEKFTPSVIEPSFGIGRIVYCIFEHCFKIRAHEATRTYFTFPPLIAPLKCSILPLISTNELTAVVQSISKFTFRLTPTISLESDLTRAGISSKIDDSTQTIGKKYARTDECGIPFAITVDFDTLQDNTVTLRDLDSMKQVRMPIVELSDNLTKLSNGLKRWEDIQKEYPAFEALTKEDEK